ncbi:MAG: helix-turn-helix transcriptional regulator, partial [Hominilimicola sp.]
ELLIIEPYLLHFFQTGTEYISRYVMNIPPEILNGFLDGDEIKYLLKGIPSCVIPLEGETQDTIKRYFIRTKSYNYRTTPLAGKLMVCYMVQFLDYINELAEKASTVFNSESLIVRPDMLEAITFIHNHYSEEDFGLDDVTEHIHMSKSRFCEVFRQTTGQTFLKYLNLVRIMPVEKELWTTNKSLTRLAEENGFSSVAHMTRVFHSVYGKAPSEYRKEERLKKGIFER